MIDDKRFQGGGGGWCTKGDVARRGVEEGMKGVDEPERNRSMEECKNGQGDADLQMMMMMMMMMMMNRILSVTVLNPEPCTLHPTRDLSPRGPIAC